MYWLIEDSKHIETLATIKYEVAYVEVIPTSHNLHAVENDICALYIRPKDDTKGYIIPINHTEGFSVPVERIQSFLQDIPKVYLLDKKWHSYFLDLPHAVDVGQKKMLGVLASVCIH